MATSRDTLLKELAALLNRYSRENGSDTPDFLLAGFLLAALEAFEEAVLGREHWWGRPLRREVPPPFEVIRGLGDAVLEELDG